MDTKSIIDIVKEHKDRQAKDQDIFDILEGDVYSKIKKAINEQLSPRAAKIAIQRIAPINILKKVVSKLTKLYTNGVERHASNEIQSDQELVSYYEEELSLNENFDEFNRNYNAYKYGAMKIYEDAPGVLKVKPIPATQIVPISFSTANKVDAMVEIVGNEGKHTKYFIYTDDQFVSVLDNGSIVESDMVDNQGVNPIGIIPFSYVTSSKYLLIPSFDEDMVQMPVLIPLLMSEVNFGMQFLANPIIYGINLNLENLNVSPNAIWNIKSDDMLNEKGQSLNVLQPQMDITNQSKWISQDLLASWLESKDIRASTISGEDNIVSGINLMIREMDTTENVKKQAVIFNNVEIDFWNRLAKYHNFLVDAGRLQAAKFSDDFSIKIEYHQPKPLEDRSVVVDTAIKEVDAMFLSQESAIKRLNPDMSYEDIQKEMKIINERKTIVAPNVKDDVITEDSETAKDAVNNEDNKEVIIK